MKIKLLVLWSIEFQIFPKYSYCTFCKISKIYTIIFLNTVLVIESKLYKFLTAFLHRSLWDVFFFHFNQFTFSNFCLDFYYPFLFGLLFLFPLFSSDLFFLDFYFPFPFSVWTFIQFQSHFGFLPNLLSLLNKFHCFSPLCREQGSRRHRHCYLRIAICCVYLLIQDMKSMPKMPQFLGKTTVRIELPIHSKTKVSNSINFFSYFLCNKK